MLSQTLSPTPFHVLPTATKFSWSPNFTKTGSQAINDAYLVRKSVVLSFNPHPIPGPLLCAFISTAPQFLAAIVLAILARHRNTKTQ